jgi:hypothetical protein
MSLRGKVDGGAQTIFWGFEIGRFTIFWGFVARSAIFLGLTHGLVFFWV